MKTPRKRITFRTPRKRLTPAIKNTTKSVSPETYSKISRSNREREYLKQVDSDTDPGSATLDEVNALIDLKEKESLEMYRLENKYLREIKNEAILFKKFTGIEIFDAEKGYLIEQSIDTQNGTKMIKFELREEKDAYIYKLVKSNSEDLPDFLREDISFEKKEVHKFFFKVLEFLLARNS